MRPSNNWLIQPAGKSELTHTGTFTLAVVADWPLDVATRRVKTKFQLSRLLIAYACTSDRDRQAAKLAKDGTVQVDFVIVDFLDTVVGWPLPHAAEGSRPAA